MKYENQIIHGDCLEVMKELPEESIDLVIADLPWNLNVEEFDYHSLFSLLSSVLKENKAIFCFWSSKSIADFEPIFREYFYLKNIISLQVNNFITHPFDSNALDYKWFPLFFGVKGKLEYNVGKRCLHRGYNSGDGWNCSIPQSNWKEEEKRHPNQKPIAVMKKIVDIFSDKGDLILDPFIGSGTTAIACKQLNRKYIGIELNEAYVEMARERVRKQEEPISNYL